jgi:two-component system, cell cycle sensor histidine kinase and response regulator CckA
MTDRPRGRELRDAPGLLLVEVGPGGAEDLCEMLRRAQQHLPELLPFTVDGFTDLAAVLGSGPPPALAGILLDFTLSEAPRLGAVQAVQEAAPGVPIVVLGEDPEGPQALEAVRGGCDEYVVKSSLTPRILGRIVAFALERRRRFQMAAERRLQESEERFQSAFEYAAIGMALVAPDGHWLKVNRALCAILGYSEKELLEGSFQEITHPDDLASDLENVRRLLAGRIPTYQMEKRYLRKDGAVVWALLSVSLVRDEAGEPLYFVSQVQDITETSQGREVLERRVTELSALSRMAIVALESRDEEELFRRTLEEGLALLHIEMGGVLILDQEAGELEMVASRGGQPELLAAAHRIRLGDGLAGKVAQSGKPMAIADAAEYPGPLGDLLRESGIRSLAALPLIGRKGIVGVIDLAARRPSYFDEAGLEMLTGIVNQVALGLERLHLMGAQREALEFNDLILESSPLGILTFAASGGCLTVNDAAVEIVGGSRERMLEQNFREIESWRESGFLAAAEEALATGERCSLETHLKTSFKREAWVEAHFARFWAGGEPHLLLVAGDITERKKIEAALRASEVRYRRVVENMNDALVVDAADGRLVFVNDRFLEMFGVEREAVAEMTFEDFVAPESRRALRARHDRLIRGEEVEEGFEYQAVRPDGRRLWVEIRVTRVLDDRGEIVGTQAVLRDVTERKEAEEIRGRLVAILDTTPDFVGIADTNGDTLYLNRAGREILGLAEDAALSGIRILDCHPEWAGKLILETGIPAALREGVWQGETALRDHHGRELSVSQVILRHQSEDGRAVFLSTVARDLSRTKELEEQVRLAQKMEAIGRLAGGVAHDFNNLLTAILGYSELLLLDNSLDTKRRSQIDEIAKAGTRAAALTRQLLTFSRREAVEPEVLDLNARVKGLEAMVMRVIGEDVVFSTALDPAAPRVFGDSGQIEQILLNLVVNGRDAMPGGGRLSVRTALVQAEAPLSTAPPLGPGNYAALIVRDTGHGMDAGTRQRIFEPFFTTKPPGKGTGLGLSTIFGIVEAHGGGIAVDSTPGAGSTFTVYLPAAGPEEIFAASRSEPVVERPPGATPATILVVEDERPTGILVQRLLERQGYEVLIAFSPAEALPVLRDTSRHLDLLLTDVIMPEMSGPQLLDEARRLRPGLAALFTSGYTADRLDGYDLEQKEVQFLHKPFRGAQLYRAVEMALAAPLVGRLRRAGSEDSAEPAG